MKLNTLSYVLGAEDTIETGKEYYFGQLWDGDGDGEEYIVDFEILEAAEDILQTRVKVIGIN
jgi:hypothetical protein